FGFNSDRAVHGVGYGKDAPGDARMPGPCITGAVDMRASPALDSGLIFEEGVIPSAFARMFVPWMMTSAAAMGIEQRLDFGQLTASLGRDVVSLFRGAHHGAVDHTLTLLSMGHDDSPGEMKLEDDRLRLIWP